MTELEKAQARAKEINEKIEGLKGLVEEKATSKDIEEAIEKAFEGKSLKDIANQMVEIKDLAEEAGLKAEDIILELNNEEVTINKTLGYLIQKYQIGDIISLKILRNGEEITLQATLAERLDL
jgi:serine protease Do